MFGAEGGAQITEPLVIVLGDGRVGVSTLLNALEPELAESFVANTHTASFKSRRNVMHELFSEHMRWSASIERQLVLRRADAFVLAFAVDQPRSFASLETYLAEVREEGLPGLPVFVAGLRADRPHAVPQKQIDDFCHKFGLTYAPCVALTGDVAALRALVDNVAVCRDRAPPVWTVRAQSLPAAEVEAEAEPVFVTVTAMPQAKKARKPCLLL